MNIVNKYIFKYLRKSILLHKQKIIYLNEDKKYMRKINIKQLILILKLF